MGTVSAQATTRRKDLKRQRIKEFAVIMYLLVISEATFIRSHQHDCLKFMCSHGNTNKNIKTVPFNHVGKT